MLWSEWAPHLIGWKTIGVIDNWVRASEVRLDTLATRNGCVRFTERCLAATEL